MNAARFFLIAPVFLASACSAGGKAEGFGTGGDTWLDTGGTTSGSTGTGGSGSGGSGSGGTTGLPSGTGGINIIGLLPDGGSVPYAGYDPTVAFDWPQTTSTTGTCKAGHYHGSFIGIYQPGITFVGAPVPVAGDIDLTLTQSSTGEYFDISGGKVCGLADGLFPFAAEVQGTLNCTTGKLENGFLKNGVYYVGPLPAYFEGPLQADYNKLTQAFSTCTWEVGEPTWPRQWFGGAGAWEATWSASPSTVVCPPLPAPAP